MDDEKEKSMKEVEVMEKVCVQCARLISCTQETGISIKR